MENPNDNDSLGEAALWSARLRAPDCTAADRREFGRWLRAASENVEASNHIVRVATQVDIAIVADSRLQRLIELAMETANHGADARTVEFRSRPLPSRVACLSQPFRKFAPLAMAASIVVVAFALLQTPTVKEMSGGSSAATIFEAPKYAPTQATLADGSIVSLDAGATMRVAMSAGERRIELLSGRAWFDVAHDAARPFSVEANGTRTVALGTRFEVKLQGARTVVTLEQGSVAIDGPVAGANSARWREQLRPGEQLSVEQPTQGVATHDKQAVEVRDLSSWARGWLVFRDVPLTEAVREINQYSEKQILLADTALADLTVGGRFLAGDSRSVVDAIAEILPIRVVDGGSHEIMLFRRYDN